MREIVRFIGFSENQAKLGIPTGITGNVETNISGGVAVRSSLTELFARYGAVQAHSYLKLGRQTNVRARRVLFWVCLDFDEAR